MLRPLLRKRSLVRDLDLTAVESEICRLPSVQVARIVHDGDRLTEIHVVATPSKSPKQIVRDVQSIALATFGLEIDHRIVSVVQLGRNGDRGTSDPEFDLGGAAAPRASLSGVHFESAGLRARATVTLDGSGKQVSGDAEGTIASSARLRLVARAAVVALAQLQPEAEAIDVDHAQVFRVGSQDVAVVTMVFAIPPAEYAVSGSAIVRAGDEGHAVARAVLDATNRRLTQASAPR